MFKRRFADVIQEWEQLLRAVDTNRLTLAEEERDLLEEILMQVRELKADQESHRALKQEATQAIREKLMEGEDHARRIRSLARALLGPRSERLVQFQVAPLRGGGRRKAGVGSKSGDSR